MQISSVPSQVISPFATTAQATPEQQEKPASARPQNQEAANQALAANRDQTNQAAPQSEKITLSAEIRQANPALAPEASPAANDANEDISAVFAEIWKDGVKVAVVDDRGSVTALNGMPVTQFGSSGGASLAAQRAARIAMEIGGEIRVGGMSLDGPTLVMRDRLRTAYGA